MINEIMAALAGSLILAVVHALAPALIRLPERYLAPMKSFSGGTGLAYVLLYLLYPGGHTKPVIDAIFGT